MTLDAFASLVKRDRLDQLGFLPFLGPPASKADMVARGEVQENCRDPTPNQSLQRPTTGLIFR